MSERLAEPPRDDAPPSAHRSPDDEAARIPHLSWQSGDVLVGRSVTIDRPREELYAFWRNFENLPKFMHSIQRVTVIDAIRSRWRIEAPAGKSVEWQSTITSDQPGRLIAWESDEGAHLRNSGSVEFKESPEGRGTVVTVTLAYDPPGGALGQLIAKLYHKEPNIQARRDLRRFKQLMETGEVAIAAAPRSN